MKDQKKQKQTKKYMKYWNNKKEYQKWKIENDIWYLFYQSKKNNCFNEKYYLLLILLVSYLKIDNEKVEVDKQFYDVMKFLKYNSTFLVVILEDQGLTLDLLCHSTA